jgi:phosphotransferase system HPr-like phosphotransfer protein
MATTTSITTNYAGQFASKYISAALLSADTLDKGLIEILPNVNFKTTLQKVGTDDIVKDATCDFTATSTLTLTDRVLEVEPFQVNLQLCKKDYYDSWIGGQMGFSAYDSIPASFADFLFAHVAAKTAQKIEQNIWNGNAASAGEFSGLISLMTADSDVVDVTATTVTAANVIEELGKVVDAIPSALYGKEDLTIFVPQGVAKAYVRALGGFGTSGLGANGVDNKGTMWYGQGDLFFDGIRVAMVNGLPANKMVAAQSSNLYFGTGILNEKNEARILDMSEVDGSLNLRVILRFFAGVNYGIGSDVVLYS